VSAGINTGLDLAVVTAGSVPEYVEKLSKLGKTVLSARIAKLNAKIKLYAKISRSGKYAAAGKPGPKNSRQLAFCLRGCQNALKWHEDALGKAGTATATTDEDVCDDLAIIAAFEERGLANMDEAVATASVHEVTALFGKEGLGRKFAGIVAAVIGILNIFSVAFISLSSPLLIPALIYGLAWYFAGKKLYNWGKIADEKAKALHEARDTKSPEGKKRLAKKMKHIADAEKAIALLRKAQPWKNPKVAAKLAKKDPAQVREVMRVLQTA